MERSDNQNGQVQPRVVDQPNIVQSEERKVLRGDVSDSQVVSMVDPPIQQCTICRKSIPIQNLFLHNLHCFRKHILCLMCDKLLLRSDKETHIHCQHSDECIEVFRTQQERDDHMTSVHASEVNQKVLRIG